MKRLIARAGQAGVGAAAWCTASWACAQASAPAGIPYKLAADGAAPDAERWLMVVLACAGALALSIYLLRRFGARLPLNMGHAKRLRITERAALTNNAQLVVVEYDSRRLLVCVTPSGASCLRDDSAAAHAEPDGRSA